MRLALFLTVFAVTVAGLGYFAPTPPPAHDPLDVVVKSYVEIRDADGQVGSGVYIGGGHVLTADHVTSPHLTAKVVRLSEGESYRQEWTSKVVASRPHKDLALLRVEEPEGLTAARVNPSLRVVVGEPCWYVGTPRGFHASVEQSVISKAFAKVRNFRLTVANGNGTYGSSGGPLFIRRNGRYYLAGVCSQFITVGPLGIDVRSPLGFVAMPDIADFLEWSGACEDENQVTRRSCGASGNRGPARRQSAPTGSTR